MLGFERWQSAQKGLPRGSVIDHLGSIDGFEASRMEVVFYWISPSGLGVASWSFPTMDVWIEVKDSSYREGGWHAVAVSEPAQATLSKQGCCCRLLGAFTDALVADVLLPEHTLEAPLIAHVEHV